MCNTEIMTESDHESQKQCVELLKKLRGPNDSPKIVGRKGESFLLPVSSRIDFEGSSTWASRCRETLQL